MHHNDGARTGANLNETSLNTTNVTVSQFGKKFTRAVDGKIFAQPLYVSVVNMGALGTHNVVYVATEQNSLYAFDADDPNASAPLWQDNFGTPVPAVDTGEANDVSPVIGITGTPVIDVATQTIYCVASTKEGSSYVQRLHALDLATGAEKFGGPVVIAGSVSGTGDGSSGGTLAFDALRHMNRAALLLLNGYVYIAFGSHGDNPPFHGWLFGYSAGTLQQTAIFNTTPNGWGGAIWQSGQGIAADDAGNLYVETGNGAFDMNVGGRSCGGCFIKLSTPSLTVLDWFAPYNQATYNSTDYDIGNSGPLLIPGTNLIEGGAKDGNIYVLDRTSLGHFQSGSNSQIVATLQVTFGDPMHSGPVYWNSPDHGPLVYSWHQHDTLKAFNLVNGAFPTALDSSGLTKVFATSTMSASSGGGGALTVSANGNAAGTGIVWASHQISSTSSILRAFDASNISHELWDSQQNQARDDVGVWGKWVPPTVANGKVYLATNSNQLSVYGLLNVPPPTVSAVGPTSGQLNGGTNITITGAGFAAGASVSVGGVAASGVTVASATSITATTPAHAVGAVSVTVRNLDGQSGTLASAFTYLAAPPAVSTVAPSLGSPDGGTVITITGTGFAAGASVTIGGSAATGVGVSGGTTITATTPTHNPGIVDVTVTNPDTQKSTLSGAFTYASPTSPIVTENQQPGSAGWDLSAANVGTDAVGQIKGYASAPSVNKGDNITFFVTVNPAQTYTIDIYRVGWYQGLGGRLMQHVGPIDGVPQPACPMDAVTGMIECHWAPGYTLTTQTSWTSGVYLAVLTNAQSFRNYMVFVVRDDGRASALLYQQSVATYQANNNYPDDQLTGKSLNDSNSYGVQMASSGSKAAAKVSFDRPYSDSGRVASTGEINFIRWLERSGYDVSYSTDVDTHANGSALLSHRGFLAVGQDAYWSKQMYDAVTGARDAGVNIGFFGANAAYWQIRFEASSSGVANRVAVCYKDVNRDPIADPTLKTINWRDPVLGRPEQTLVGVQYIDVQPVLNPALFVMSNSGNWVYSGTGVKDGDVVSRLVGPLADGFQSAYPPPTAASGTYTLLSSSAWGPGPNDLSNASVYQAPSGAWVFAAGSLNWNLALDSYSSTVADVRVQRASANVIERFLAATMTSPTPGTPLTGKSATFNWSTTDGASSYWLEVGSTLGAHDYFGQSTGPATSQTVNNLPILGNAVFVRLWTEWNGRWQFNDYTYTALNVKAAMVTPTLGSTLGSATVTFTWNSVSGAAAYWLEVGIAAGGHNLFGQGVGVATNQAVSGLPIVGGPIYVRLWTQFNGVWAFNDYIYSAFNAKASMTSPSPGSVLAAANVTFNWTTGTGATAYWLDVGTTAGAGDLFGHSVGLATSQAVNALPTGGSPIYVRLWTQLNGGWLFNDYVYTALNAKASMTSPAPGSVLVAGSVTFSWTAAAGGSAYWLDVGTTAGGGDLFGQNVGLAMSQTVSGLPLFGGPIFVRLWTLLNGTWIFNDYTYTMIDARATMAAPVAGSVLGPNVTFNWNPGTGASQYWLDVGTTAGASDLFGGSVGLNTSQTVTNVPALGNTIYVRLWSLLGDWEYHDYVYVAAGP
jgi:hypothetical protein